MVPILYYANPCGPNVLKAMQDGLLGFIDTPAQGNARPEGVRWCADNGCFSDKWDEGKWLRFLTRNVGGVATCDFATLPDVVGDAAETLKKSSPWIGPVKELGYPVAFVAQDGQESVPIPWGDIDAIFIGGTTEFKLGAYSRDLVAEAKSRGLWAHMGRVNSRKRFRYASSIGCDSADGTYLTFGPDTNLPKLLSWVLEDRESMAMDFGAEVPM